jgi:hypothetical protein
MCSRIELWTNDSESEFAIMARSHILAKTAEGNFTKSIDKTSFDRKKIYNWNLMIHNWITFYFSIKYSTDLMNKRRSAKKKFLPVGSPAAVRRIRPRIKCSFCGLKFHGIDDRQEHEVMWHSNKTCK